jgi:hypothetical protein
LAILSFVLLAFEVPAAFGPSAAMLAGCAVPCVQNGLATNPALLAGPGAEELRVGYARPYGVDGLNRVNLGGVWRRGALALAGGWSSLSCAAYSESDVQVSFGYRSSTVISAGVSAHALVLAPGSGHVDAVPALDAGVSAGLGAFTVGLAVQRVNSPRWRDGAELPTRAVLGVSWQPVDAFLMSLDLSREPGIEAAGVGAELRIARQLVLRFGVGTTPLRIAGGTAVQLGPVEVDYAYQFHQSLGDTHTLGLSLRWH